MNNEVNIVNQGGGGVTDTREIVKFKTFKAILRVRLIDTRRRPICEKMR